MRFITKKGLLAVLMCICMLVTVSLPEAKAKEGNRPPNNIAALKSDDASIDKEKTYCSPFAKTKYKLLINKGKVRITRLYKEYKDVFTGVIKNGKIYSNDPEEKKYKPVWGKYYKLSKEGFSVLNIENGDYELFSICND